MGICTVGMIDRGLTGSGITHVSAMARWRIVLEGSVWPKNRERLP